MTLHELSTDLSLHILDLCERFLSNGRKSGNRWIVGDILNNKGDSCGVELDGPKQGFWFDHAAKEGGDALELVAKAQGISIGDAAKWAREYLNVPEEREAFDPLRKGWKKDGEWHRGSVAWHYPEVDAYVVRFNFENGKKDTIPLRFLPPENEPPDKTNSRHWRWKGFNSPEPKPIYRLRELSKRPDAQVLVVEGEKTADAAAKLFPDHAVITWQGGSAAVDRVDWSVLTGRNVLLWPDNDSAGRKAMTHLKARFPDATVVSLPTSLPERWDLADPLPAGITIDSILNPPATPPPTSTPKPAAPKVPFRCLGHDDAGFHYLSFRSNTIVSLDAPSHNEMNLQLVADDDFWLELSLRLNSDSESINWKAVAKFLIGEQMRTGFYDDDRIRGLGCWVEHPSSVSTHHGNTPAQRVVFHAGDRLYVNGIETAIQAHDSHWIYPARKSIRVDLSRPATTDQAKRLVELSTLLPWSAESWPWLLPAMCFIAPICGALEWRPHAWLVGSKGVGKTWIFSNFIHAILGNNCMQAVSSTTEAAIRQKLQSDAIPVIFDEIEAKDERSAARIQNVLELARQASSETGGSIFKGSASGVAKQFRIRSSFIFSSIVSGATEAADESRIARMELSADRRDAAKFDALQAQARETLQSPEWCESIRARAVHLAPAIRISAAVFQRAIAAVAGDARKGQQYGAIAAGYWHLMYDNAATPADAQHWASQVKWNDVGLADNDNDETRALDTLLQYRTTMQAQDGTRYDHSVEELIGIFFRNVNASDAAKESLLRIGVCPSRSLGCIDIAVRHVELGKVYRGSHFADRWKDHLLRIKGAKESVANPGRGMKAFKAVRVLWERERLPLDGEPAA
jgi:putative DNA primase/helicase